MFSAIKIFKNKNRKQKLIIKENEKIIANDEVVANKIADYYKSIFNKDLKNNFNHIRATEMTIPFSESEVTIAIKKLKNGRCAGIDNIFAEHLKHGPKILNKHIATILNNMAKSGKVPEEINNGIIIPIQKPGKEKGIVENLRPIILLSVLRKILALIMLNRLLERFNDHIPISQSAYRRGRSTTENVFTFKILAEKAITSNDFAVNILLLDMSKAFDCVNRFTLFDDLKELLESDELHIMKLLLLNITLKVRCEKNSANLSLLIQVFPREILYPLFFSLYT